MVRSFKLPFARGYSLRMHKIGCANRHFYLIGAMPTKTRVGNKVPYRPDEVLGSVDPMPNDRGELVVACDLSRFSYYLGMGAKPSRLLTHYMGLVGFLPIPPKIYINAERANKGLSVRGGIRQMPTSKDPPEANLSEEAKAG